MPPIQLTAEERSVINMLPHQDEINQMLSLLMIEYMLSTYSVIVLWLSLM
jgi:hypothetical protein